MTIIRKRIEEIEPMNQERAEAILELDDDEIDLSDIPELDETFFKQAKQVMRLEEVSTAPVAKYLSAQIIMQATQPILAENRVILNPVSWDTFNQLLQELGDKRSQLLVYSQGTMEIMTPLGKQEHSNR